MKPKNALFVAEQVCLVGHIVAMAFGLAGLLLVVPHPEFILALPAWGQQLFQWSMGSGGVVYIVLGALAIALHTYRNFWPWQTLWLFAASGRLFPLRVNCWGQVPAFPLAITVTLVVWGTKLLDWCPSRFPSLGFIWG